MKTVLEIVRIKYWQDHPLLLFARDNYLRSSSLGIVGSGSSGTKVRLLGQNPAGHPGTEEFDQTLLKLKARAIPRTEQGHQGIRYVGEYWWAFYVPSPAGYKGKMMMMMMMMMSSMMIMTRRI